MTKQIQSPNDVFRHPEVIRVLNRMLWEAKTLQRNDLVKVMPIEGSNGYDIECLIPSLDLIAQSMDGHDICGMAVSAMWFMDGLNLIRPTPEQAESFANVAIDLKVKEFSSPYRTVMVELQNNPRFSAAVVTTGFNGCIATTLYTRSGEYDITTMIRDCDDPIENSLRLFNGDPDLERDEEQSKAANRVALNMCLALVNYGHTTAPAYPKQKAEDERLAKHPGDKGERAKQRLAMAMNQVSFIREVVVRRTTATSDGSTPTGRTVAPHWVRGHWKMQAHGPQSSLRKRILIKPYLVHADRVTEIPHRQLTAYTDKRD